MSHKSGHISLNGEEYMIEVGAYQQSLANPMGAKLGTGAGDYEDLEDWAAWLMDDWRAGVGQRDPVAGGFLYGTADTRFERQLTLPPLWTLSGLSSAAMRQPGNVEESITIDTGDTQRVACVFTAPSTETVTRLWVLAKAGAALTVGIWSDSGGSPNAAISSGSVTTSESQPGWLWLGVDVSASLTASTDYWVVVSGSGVDLGASTIALGDAKAWNGSAWSNKLGSYASNGLGFFYVVGTAGLASNGQVVDIVEFNGSIYAAAGTRVYKYSAGTWAAVGSARSATITDLHVFESKLWIALGDGTNLDTMSTGEVYTNGSVTASKFADSRGYLYRATANDLYYSADGSTWTGPLEMGPDDYSIRGLAPGDGVDMYANLDGGLSVLVSGDIPQLVTTWGGIEVTNGRAMVHHQGDIYQSVGPGVVRYAPSSGLLIEMGLDQGEGLPSLRAGRVRTLASMQDRLLAFVEPGQDEGMPSLWGWNSEGWNALAVLPAGMGAGPLLYDRTNQKIWMGTGAGLIASFSIPADTVNPVKDSTMTYAPCAWLETDWFSGGLKEVQKDVESLYLSGEEFSDGQTVSLYWQDDDSTDWEMLGTVTADRQEIIWSTNRPNTREIRLGLLLETDDRTETPLVRAVRLKYLPMVTDRYRWNVVIRAADGIERLDGRVEPRTAAQQRADLLAAAASVPPVTFRDLDGTEYSVKVEQMVQTVGKVEHFHDGLHYVSFYRLSLLQV